MTSRFLKIIAMVIFLGASTQALAQKPDLIGMAQISRSDGALTFALIGGFSERSACIREVQTFTEGVLSAANSAGFSATIDFAACDQKAPPGSEFEALRKGTPTTHYMFFTPSLRMMLVHERGSLEYERQSCEYFRGQFLSKLQIKAKCLAPLKHWQDPKLGNDGR